MTKTTSTLMALMIAGGLMVAGCAQDSAGDNMSDVMDAADSAEDKAEDAKKNMQDALN